MAKTADAVGHLHLEGGGNGNAPISVEPLRFISEDKAKLQALEASMAARDRYDDRNRWALPTGISGSGVFLCFFPDAIADPTNSHAWTLVAFAGIITVIAAVVWIGEYRSKLSENANHNSNPLGLSG